MAGKLKRKWLVKEIYFKIDLTWTIANGNYIFNYSNILKFIITHHLIDRSQFKTNEN